MQRQFVAPTGIYFGKDSLSELKKIPMKMVCIVTDFSMLQIGLVSRIEKILLQRGIEYKIFDKVKPDPSLEIVTEGVRHLIETKPDTVIAVGGGSVLDTAKAIIYLDLKLQEKIARKEDVKKTFLIAIPTTSGTGSEVTSYSVVTNEKSGLKIPLQDKRMIPDIAILDSGMTETLPPKVIAESGMDVLTHGVEAYVSNCQSPFSRGFAVEAIQLVRDNLVSMFSDISLEEKRMNMHMASCLGGLSFECSSLGLNHGMAHALGGTFHLSHGLCNAILLPYVIRFNSGIEGKYRENLEVLEQYSQIAELFGIKSLTKEEKVRKLTEHIRDLGMKLQLPVTLKEANIPKKEYFEKLDFMVKAAMMDHCTSGNPVRVSEQDVRTIYMKAYEG